ncbi:Uu.00g106760.m01.CDS01 [Anthostomella pinea]|uniref:Uu.00g106760.m01.CDS01 n=1 Tax=Anthostomella pinea TaxID=933095 RepID=A0AAI8YFX1_9PEZI|nr:Uu.00g106760.m01.CDS01 [Anthostomella pinea]
MKAGRRRIGSRSASTSAPILTIALSIVASVAAIPIDYFPLNSQLPPVARVSEPFTFTLLPQTFSSSLDITYSLSADAPAWLSLDSDTRTLSGTPGDEDVPRTSGAAGAGEAAVVGVPISLVATDATGSATSNATLVVSRDTAPAVALPLAEQIFKFGAYSAPLSLLLPPKRDFSFEFAEDTFQTNGNQSQLSYYAVSEDNAPLPSWVTFDSGTLAFSGTTPPFESLVQPPQTFGFQLVASDVVGFSSAAIPFSIVVGVHELTSDVPVIKLNTTRGMLLEYTDLPQVLKIDDRPLQMEDVASITAVNLPPWFAFDGETWALTGTPDSKAKPTNVTIAVVDHFTDSLNVTLAIEFEDALFVSDLPDLNVTVGDDFSFGLKRFLFDPMDTEVTVESEPDGPWVHFDDSSLTLSGTVPEPLSAGFANEVRVTFNATSRRTAAVEIKYMNIHVAPPTTSGPTKPTATLAPKPTSESSGSDKSLLWLIIIPVLLILAIILLLFYMRRRRQRPNNFNVGDVSAPIPGTFVANGSAGSLHDMQKMLDLGPPHAEGSTSVHQTERLAAANSSNLRSSYATSDPRVHRGEATGPHAFTMHSGAVRPTRHSNILLESRDSWLAGHTGQFAEKNGDTDQVSLLSDTSLGEGDDHVTQASSSSAGRYPGDQVRSNWLEVPMIGEPFSIQHTPEVAYTAGRGYEYSSDEDVLPAVGYATRPKSGQQQEKGLGLRGVGHRLSKAWIQGNASKLLNDIKRHSTHSTSTALTTRTSILTSCVAEEATKTTANVITKPTVVHIPSKPGEARRVSRRTHGTTPLFGGGSVIKSPRNLRLSASTSSASVNDELPLPPPAFKESTVASCDSDTAWNRLARNSLGIAYKDLVRAGPAERRALLRERDPLAGLSQSDNWRTHHTTHQLMSPDQWPIPDNFTGIGIPPEATRNRSEPPQTAPLKRVTTTGEPATPRGKGKGRATQTRRASRGSGSDSLKSQTPSTSSRTKRRSSRQGSLRISRIREKRATDELRATISHTPSSSNEWALPAAMRPLPETPTRPSRAPLTHRLNASNARPGDRMLGGRSAVSKRSQRTMRSAKSVPSVWADDNEDDDDAWEDIRPPESTVGGWDEEQSEGSFLAYI